MKKFEKIIEEISNVGIVPVVKLENVDDAVYLAKALKDGGINCAEVTFRAKGAEMVIKNILKEFPDMLVGAGTVTTIEQVDMAIEAGAKFCVAPGLNPKIVKHCLDKGVLFIPGVANSSDIETAMELGLDTLKFFPAEQAGGINYIKAVSAPYGNIKFMPTGGINEQNLNDYLAFDKIIACGGSWMVNGELIKQKKWDEIKQLSEKAVKKLIGYEFKHLGINSDEKNAINVANMFASAFNYDVKEGEKSIFADTTFEVMKKPAFGLMGHIAIACNSVQRAIYNLSQKGFEFDYSTEKKNDKGITTFIYLKQEFGGFAIHLIKK